jgi:hypothetical protein
MQKLVTRNIKDETMGHDTYKYNNLFTNQLSPQEPQCTMWLHIYRMWWKRGSYAWAFLDIVGPNKDCHMTWAWRHTSDGLAPCWVTEKLQPHSQEKHWRGLWPTAVHRRAIYYTISVKPGCRWTHKGIQCDTPGYVLYSSEENSQILSYSFRMRVSLEQHWWGKTEISIYPQKV